MTSNQTRASKKSRERRAPRNEERANYLSHLIDQISDALISTDLDFNVLEWNAAAEAMYGWKADEVTGRLLAQFIQNEYHNTTREQALKTVQNEGCWKGEVIQNRKDGTRFPVIASVSLLRDSAGQPVGFVAINRDMTDRQQTEEKIAWLASFPERNPNPVIEIDATGAIFYMNPAARAKFPDLERRGFGHSWLAGLEVVMSQLRNEEICEFQREIEFEQKWYSQPSYYIAETGRLRVYATEITERKHAEQQAVQMKRLYATLSQVNQMIVRVKERQELFQTICDVAVKYGEFSGAWIGILDEASGEIHPEAANGLDLTNATFPVFNVQSGAHAESPIAQAIRTSRVITSENVQANLQLEAERSQFQNRGWYSEAVIPFRSKGKTIGVLNLVSQEKFLFNNDDEVLLLDEMGLDISFALDIMESERERRLAEEKVRQQNQHLKILREIDLAILGADSLEAIVGAALTHIRKLMSCRWTSILLFDWKTNEGRVFDLYTAVITAIPKGAHLPLEWFEDLLPTLWKKQPVLVEDLRDLTDPIPPFATLLKEGSLSVCVIPLFAQDQLIGLFNLSSEEAGYFGKEEVELAREVANQTAIAITQSRLVEALLENEERLRLSLQAANQGLYDLNVQTGEAVVNREYALMLGYDPQTFVETNAAWIERLHPDDRESVAKAYSDYVSGALPEYRIEFRQRTKDGNWKWILSLGKVIEYEAEGRPLRMLGTHTDITARKRAEDEIRSRSHQLATLLEASQSLTESLNLSQVLQRFTDKAAEVLATEATAIYLVDGGDLYMGACSPPLLPDFPDMLRKAKLTDHPHIAEALETGQIVTLPDAATAQLSAAEETVIAALGLRTVIYIPLIARKDAIGILTVGNVGVPREFSNEEKDLAHALSNQAALAIANAKLYEDLARYVDELENQIRERVRVQQELQASEERYRLISENSADVIWVLDPLSGQFTYVSPSVEKLRGYTPAEVMAQPFSEALTPESLTLVNEVIARELPSFLQEGSGTRSFTTEVDQPCKDGSIVHTEATTTYLFNSQGRIQVVGVSRNINERKQAQKALSRSEERFRLLFERNHAIMMLIEPESGIIRSANSAAAEFYGYPLAYLCGMNISDINVLTPEEVYTERMRALKEERNFFKFQHRLANGDIRSVEVHSAPLEVDGNILLFSMVYDMTDYRQAEEKLNRHVNYLTGLREIDQAIASSFDSRLSLSILTSRAVPLLKADAASILILDPVTNLLENVAGHGFRTSILHGEGVRLGESYAGRAVMERQMVRIPNLALEIENWFPRDFLKSENFVSYYGVPLIVKGKVVGVMEVFNRTRVERDQEWLDFLNSLAGQAAIAIDNARLWEQVQRHARELEMRVAERTAALNRTNAELEHANQTKDEFLANMSHELRTPLNSILGLSESLLEQRRDPLTSHQQRSLEIVASSGHHLLELINDVLDLSKIEAGKFDYYPQNIDVDSLCRSSLSFVKNQAARKSITITYSREGSLANISADPRRLKQILVNLLTNAVKFTPERGQVILAVSSDAEQNLISFTVEDNGIGIALPDLKRLFKPFVQVDSKLNRQFEGTGLGLALVQKLTDLHGGSVEVESEIGVGSRFTVNLPWKQPDEIQEEQSAPDGTNALQDQSLEGISVLLAEDNMANILTISEYLESHGCSMVNAHDGLEAIEKAIVSNPDIVLMDIQMPAMDGLEATQRLRTNPRFASTPIIAITALAMPGDRERCLAAGADEYMSKPISLKSLRETMLRLIGRQKS